MYHINKKLYPHRADVNIVIAVNKHIHSLEGKGTLIHCYQNIIRPLGFKRVHLPLYKVAYTPFHIQGDDIYCLP